MKLASLKVVVEVDHDGEEAAPGWVDDEAVVLVRPEEVALAVLVEPEPIVRPHRLQPDQRGRDHLLDLPKQLPSERRVGDDDALVVTNLLFRGAMPHPQEPLGFGHLNELAAPPF